jgi:hypothetical protein
MRLDDLEALLLDPELPSVLILRGKGSGSVPMTDLLRLVRERADPAASEQELDTLMTTLGARRATTIDLSHFRRRLLGLLAGRTWPSGETIYECQATSTGGTVFISPFAFPGGPNSKARRAALAGSSLELWPCHCLGFDQQPTTTGAL